MKRPQTLLSRRLARRLSAMLDGERSPGECARLQQQAEHQPAVQETLDAWTQIDRLLDARPEPAAIPDVRERVLARVHAHQRRRPALGARRPLGWERPAWALGWAAAGLLVGLWLGVHLNDWARTRSTSEEDYRDVALQMLFARETMTLSRVVADADGWENQP